MRESMIETLKTYVTFLITQYNEEKNQYLSIGKSNVKTIDPIYNRICLYKGIIKQVNYLPDYG